MSPHLFHIEQVQPEWVLQPEEMGGKQKFWYRQPVEDATSWLFKYPRPNSGEHWAEKIAAEVSAILQVSCARVELALFEGSKGTASENFLGEDQQLFHGNQILAYHLDNYNPGQRFRQPGHTLENIWLALERIFEEVEGSDAAKRLFGKFLVLDAVIGNTDRHHENWGVVRRRDEDGDGWLGYLAPTFDHASSLGRELLDVRRDAFLAGGRVGNYSERGSGGIYCLETGMNALSPLELVRLAYRKYPVFLAPALDSLADIDEEVVSDIFECMPPGWMSDSAKNFAIALIEYNCQQLRELVTW